MPLFEVAILEVPTDKERKAGKEERLIFGPSPVIAKDDRAAAMRVAFEQKDIEVKFDQMRVLVRPFA